MPLSFHQKKNVIGIRKPSIYPDPIKAFYWKNGYVTWKIEIEDEMGKKYSRRCTFTNNRRITYIYEACEINWTKLIYSLLPLNKGKWKVDSRGDMNSWGRARFLRVAQLKLSARRRDINWLANFCKHSFWILPESKVCSLKCIFASKVDRSVVWKRGHHHLVSQLPHSPVSSRNVTSRCPEITCIDPAEEIRFQQRIWRAVLLHTSPGSVPRRNTLAPLEATLEATQETRTYSFMKNGELLTIYRSFLWVWRSSKESASWLLTKLCRTMRVSWD